MKISRKAAPVEPPRPVVRRVARVAEPPLIPVEPTAPAPEPEPMAEALPVPYVARTEEPRRGIFRRIVDAVRGGDDDTPDDPDAGGADELPEDATVVEPDESAPVLGRAAAPTIQPRRGPDAERHADVLRQPNRRR